MTESYCLSGRKLGFTCSKDAGGGTTWVEKRYYLCPEYSTCIGDGRNDVMNRGETRSAACVPEVKRIITWAAKKVANSLQCRNFQFASTSLGVVLDDTSSGMMAVQVTHDEKVTYPPMPEVATLSYQGASYPIQSIEQKDMETQYGSFAFTNTFDATQPLTFCVSVPTKIHFDWAFISYSSSDQGVGYRRGNITYDKGSLSVVG